MSNYKNYLLLGLTLLLTSIITVKSRPNITITQTQTNLSEATDHTKNITDVSPIDGFGEDIKDPFDDTLFSYIGFIGTFWNIQNITYKILNHPTYLKKTDIETEVARAFLAWSEHTNLTFTPKDAGEVDIKIEFLTKDHGDDVRFNGRGGILGHASDLGEDAYVHFDNDEYWTINSTKHYDSKTYLTDNTTSLDFFQNAVHEFGHILGLQHSKYKPSAMAYSYEHYEPNFKLNDLDIKAIQYLYGSKSSPNINGPFGDFAPPCDNKTFLDLLPNISKQIFKIDAIFNSVNNQIYVFDDHIYCVFDRYSLTYDTPKLISDGWPGLPGDLDAAFAYKDGKTYFFKGTKYWRYNGSQIDDGFPKKISEGFPGIPDHLDTAMVWDDSGKIYFFKGSKFWSFDPTMQPPVKSNYIRIYSNWKGLPVNLDVAFVDLYGYSYFFKDNKAYEIDANRKAVFPKTKKINISQIAPIFS